LYRIPEQKGRIVTDEFPDVLIVGAGNAALCAALSARELGASVHVLEWAPESLRGGNSRFTGGLIRFTYDSVSDLKQVIPDMSDHDIQTTEFGSYSREDFFNDIDRVTQFRSDPELIPIMVDQSFDTVRWLHQYGVRFVPAYGHQAFRVGDKMHFWGGLTVMANGGGPGLIDSLSDAVEKLGVKISYGMRALDLVLEQGTVVGVTVKKGGETITIRSKTVVLACGGFEANAEWRTRYLGPGWDLAKVRGTRFNMGDGIRMALNAGAMPTGNWSGCHAVGWDRNAPEFGDLSVGDGFQKHSYPLGIMVNARGERFVDEGFDFRNYTYARYGKDILQQPGQLAWQVFDGKVLPLLRDEYRIREVTRVRADTIQELAQKMEDVDSNAFLETVRKFNEGVRADIPFNPAIKDGRGTENVTPPKSNWANALDTPPFEAYATTCGITFTFGGVRINTQGQVLDVEERPIPGLYAAGELVGGLFYFNYPGGTGLTSGAVFGRIAGKEAAKEA
jgi:tricarballylate dehydrogenase